MRFLFESWRKFITDPKLLVEGRIADAKKKYPRLANVAMGATSGGNWLKALVHFDPSGNQKYLMWAAKMLHESGEDAERASPSYRGHVPEYFDGLVAAFNPVMKSMEIFHKLQGTKFLKKRDINEFKNLSDGYDELKRANDKYEESLRLKQRQEKIGQQAREESKVIADTDQYKIIRPLSTEASCYYGRGTKWCISATQSQNYFDSYTEQGQKFFFVFLNNLKNDNLHKKIALVFDEAGDYSEAFDARDNDLDHEEVEFGLRQNLINQKKYPNAWNYWRDFILEPMPDMEKRPVDPDFIKAVQELGIEFDPNYEQEVRHDEHGSPYVTDSMYEYTRRAIGEVKTKASSLFNKMINEISFSIEDEEDELIDVSEFGIEEHRRFKKWRTLIK